MEAHSPENYLSRIEELENRLAEAEQLIEAIKAGEVDAFALNKNNQAEVFTLHSGDYAYRVLVENVREGALNLTEDGLIVYTNTFFHEALKLSYEKVIGKNIFQFIHPESAEAFNELFKKGLAGQSKGEINLIAGGQTFPVYVSLTSLYPTLSTVGMIVTDLGERKAQEKILKQSEEKFNKLFLGAPLGLVLSEIPSGKITDANEIYYETIGYSSKECIGKTSVDLNLIEKNLRERLLEPLEKDGFVKNVEVEIIRKSGEKIPILTSIEKIIINDKEYLLSAIINITERKKAERKIEENNVDLQKINKELEAFTYISSHDLQEPLRKIQIFAGRLLEKEDENLSETGKDYFRRIMQNAGRMQTLIQDLLAFSRINSAERQFELTSLREIVDEVKTELAETLEEKEGTIETISLCDEARISRFQFRQLMHNLIGNSLKFSKPGVPPVITIESRLLDSYPLLAGKGKVCHMVITDNGIGFEQRFSEQIFKIFQRLHGRDEYAGTGIGLAIVKKIVENHNGIITATSESGKGTQFDIYIPA